MRSFYQRAPDAVKPHVQLFRQMLCDKDPAVMSASLCALQHLIAVDPSPYKNLVPSFVNILKQVVEQRLPKAYNYHRVPAPFIQVIDSLRRHSRSPLPSSVRGSQKTLCEYPSEWGLCRQPAVAVLVLYVRAVWCVLRRSAWVASHHRCGF